MIRYVILLLLGCSLTTGLIAQKNTAFTEAVNLYDSAKYIAAEKKFDEALQFENKKAKPDIATRASVYNYLGICVYQQYRSAEALDYYNLSINDFNTVKDYTSLANVVKNIDLVYKYAGKDFFETNKPVDSSDKTNEIFFPVTYIDSQNEDSATVLINGGINMGVFKGAVGNIMISYNSTREQISTNAYFGSAQVIAVNDTAALVQIQFNKKQANKTTKAFIGDLVVLKLYQPAQKITGILNKLSALDIIFTNAYRDTVITKKALLNNKEENLESNLADYYLYDIHDFYSSYMFDKTDTVFTTIYKKGRFKGMTMKDAFRLTEKEDLYAFLNFVKSYPGKYMGRSWKLIETYATWLLNEMPEWEPGNQWLLPFISNTPENKIDSFARRYAWYIYKDSLASYINGVSELYNADKMPEALSLNNKLLRIAQLFKNKKVESDFVLYRSYIWQKMEKTELAFVDARSSYSLTPNSVNAASNLGLLYGKLEKYDSCFAILESILKTNPERYDITGNLGWYKILAGKWKEANTLCKKAYESDTSSYSYAVNYGHTFLLADNRDSAMKYYAKMLEHLNYPKEYTEGPKKDFELFFNKGWSRSAVAAALDWIDEKYTSKYSYITNGNIVWDEAKKLYDAKKYNAAADKWKEYVDGFNGAKDPPYLYIHNAFAWTGYSYALNKNYNEAEKYYIKSVDLARSLPNFEDKLISDYERLFNFYNDFGNNVKAREFKLMYDVAKQKSDDAKARPHLFFVAVEGKNYLQPESKNNALVFFDSVKTAFSGSFDETQTFYVGGNKLSKSYLLNVLDSVKKQGRPEDIFMFYYTGTVINEGSTNSFLLDTNVQKNNDRVDESELAEALKSVFTQKKLILFNVPASGVMAKLSKEYNSDSYISNELIFLCPGTLMPVNTSTKYSVFTQELLNSLKELTVKEKFTAKDFVTKTTDGLGSGNYYLPVLSFQYAKDFVLYKSTRIREKEIEASRSTITDDLQEEKVADLSQSGKRKNYALLISCDNYDDKNFKTLSNPSFDATELGRILKDDYGFDTSALTNGTKADVQRKLSKYRDNIIYNPDDQLFIFFAGHGTYDRNADMGYLAARDSKKDDYNHDSYLSYSDLASLYLKNIKCNRVFLVLDACFAGTFFGQGYVSSSKDKTLKYFKGMSSGAKEYVSDGRPGHHSPFANSLIAQFKNKNIANLTADIIIANIKSNPPQETSVCEGPFYICHPNSLFKFEQKAAATATEIKSAEGDAAGGLSKPAKN